MESTCSGGDKRTPVLPAQASMGSQPVSSRCGLHCITRPSPRNTTLALKQLHPIQARLIPSRAWRAYPSSLSPSASSCHSCPTPHRRRTPDHSRQPRPVLVDTHFSALPRRSSPSPSLFLLYRPSSFPRAVRPLFLSLPPSPARSDPPREALASPRSYRSLLVPFFFPPVFLPPHHHGRPVPSRHVTSQDPHYPFPSLPGLTH